MREGTVQRYQVYLDPRMRRGVRHVEREIGDCVNHDISRLDQDIHVHVDASSIELGAVLV
jgi:hypothetical protein